jgi:hypothetical protein
MPKRRLPSLLIRQRAAIERMADPLTNDSPTQRQVALNMLARIDAGERLDVVVARKRDPLSIPRIEHFIEGLRTAAFVCASPGKELRDQSDGVILVCPGAGERLETCANPDCGSPPGLALFHPQREGHWPGYHGDLRRGRPRKFCTNVCEEWFRDHWTFGPNGVTVGRLVREWELGTTTSTGQTIVHRAYAGARKAAAWLVGSGAFDGVSPGLRDQVMRLLLTPTVYSQEASIDALYFRRGRGNEAVLAGGDWRPGELEAMGVRDDPYWRDDEITTDLVLDDVIGTAVLSYVTDDGERITIASPPLTDEQWARIDNATYDNLVLSREETLAVIGRFVSFIEHGGSEEVAWLEKRLELMKDPQDVLELDFLIPGGLTEALGVRPGIVEAARIKAAVVDRGAQPSLRERTEDE